MTLALEGKGERRISPLTRKKARIIDLLEQHQESGEELHLASVAEACYCTEELVRQTARENGLRYWGMKLPKEKSARWDGQQIETLIALTDGSRSLCQIAERLKEIHGHARSPGAVGTQLVDLQSAGTIQLVRPDTAVWSDEARWRIEGMEAEPGADSEALLPDGPPSPPIELQEGLLLIELRRIGALLEQLIRNTAPEIDRLPGMQVPATAATGGGWHGHDRSHQR